MADACLVVMIYRSKFISYIRNTRINANLRIIHIYIIMFKTS